MKWGISRGDRVLLVYPPSLDFIVAFLACLRAGVIAVPVFPPHPGRLKKDLYMFSSIQRSSGATVALTNAQYNWAKKMAGIKNVMHYFPMLSSQTYLILRLSAFSFLPAPRPLLPPSSS